MEVYDGQYIELNGMGGRLKGPEFSAGSASIEMWLHLFRVPTAAHAYVWEFGVSVDDRLSFELQNGRPCVIIRAPNPRFLHADIACAEAGSLVSGLHHLLVSFNSTSATLYVNGVLQGSQQVSTEVRPLFPYSPVTESGSSMASYRLFKSAYASSSAGLGAEGRMHKFAVYNQAVNESEAARLFQDRQVTASQVNVRTTRAVENVASHAVRGRNALLSGSPLLEGRVRLGYVPKNFDSFFDKRPLLMGCIHHVVLIGPVTKVQLGPAKLCPDIGCPPPPDIAPLKSNIMLWSDDAGWQKQHMSKTRWKGGEDVQNTYSVPEWIEVTGVPADGNSAWVPPRWVVLVDVNTSKLDVVVIEGILRFSNDYPDILFRARALNILGGELSIGSASTPYLKRATIHLHGIKNRVLGYSAHTGGLTNMTWNTVFQKKINNSGTINLYGEPRKTTTARLQYSVKQVRNS